MQSTENNAQLDHLVAEANAALTQASDVTQLTEESCQFLTFTVGEEEFGVDIMTVREVKGWSETTRLPNTPEYMRGVLNLRGVILPIFDLRMRFHNIATETTDKHVIVVLAVGDRIIGVLVDTVSDILTVNQHEIKDAPSNETEVDDRFVNGLIAIENRMVVLLNIEKLFDTTLLNATDISNNTLG